MPSPGLLHDCEAERLGSGLPVGVSHIPLDVDARQVLHGRHPSGAGEIALERRPVLAPVDGVGDTAEVTRDEAVQEVLVAGAVAAGTTNRTALNPDLERGAKPMTAPVCAPAPIIRLATVLDAAGPGVPLAEQIPDRARRSIGVRLR
jgi:hypothetical protein